MRKTFLGAAAILIASVSGPSSASGQFTPYDGDSAIQAGEGGAHVARDGVDFWTSGTPARRFQILGTLTDNRSSGMPARSAVGSPRLARQARALGADGLILAGQRRVDGGYVGVWSGGDGIAPLVGSRATSTTTTFVVVRYVD